MKKTVFLIAALVLLAPIAMAQTASDNFVVTATNQGIFQFAINQASFDFGTLSAAGGASTTGVTGTRGTAGATYEQTGALTWYCNSAPRRTVTLTQDTVQSTFTGALPSDQLEMRFPVPGTFTGTSGGYLPYGTASNLLAVSSVGNGNNSVQDAPIDLALTVNDVDPVGANTWTIYITATGT